MNNKTFTQKRKIVTILILVTSYSAFIGNLLANLQWIADWNYNIHEMLYFPSTIAYFLIPFELFLWMYYAIRSKREVKEFNFKPKINDYLINLMLLASLIFIGTYFYIESMSVSTGGLFEVEQKIQERNNYYIELNHQKIKCTHNEFNLIEEGKVYLVTFSWNEKSPSEGRLEFIEPTGVIFD